MPVEAARLAVDRNTGAGRIRFEARAGDAFDGDAVAHELTVRKYRVLETAASYGSTMGEQVSESLLFPPGIHTDAGEIGVDLSASVIGNLDGAFRYIRGFDHPSWEQRLSKGVMASHFGMLRAWLGDDLEWPQSAELPIRLLARRRELPGAQRRHGLLHRRRCVRQPLPERVHGSGLQLAARRRVPDPRARGDAAARIPREPAPAQYRAEFLHPRDDLQRTRRLPWQRSHRTAESPSAICCGIARTSTT